MIRSLSDHLDVRVGLVIAGDLIEDLVESHPEGIEQIAALVARDQVELVGTPLHGPVLSAVPERDGTEQILAHATRVKKVFGVRSVGCWIPLGVWDPSVPRVIAKASMLWCPIDDRFLVDVGAGRHGICGAWRTEREGYAVALLPVDTELRDLVGRVEVDEVFRFLLARPTQGRRHITLSLPAARFGLWPGRDPKVGQAWLATFFEKLGAATNEVSTIPPSAAAASYPQRGLVYLPSSAPRHIGVPWERSLGRYQEANRLHKKMLRVSRAVHGLEREIKAGAHSAVRPDPTLLVQARRYLYRAQDPAAYWHGEEAGIYDPVIRARTWRDLIRAEQVVRLALNRGDQMSVDCIDLNCDGIKEVVFRTPSLVVVVDPACAAGITELSWFGAHRNLVDTMTRVVEPYHAELAEGTLPDLAYSETAETDWVDETTTANSRVPDEIMERAEVGLRRSVGMDPWPRVSFIERLMGAQVRIEDILGGQIPSPTATWELITTERRGDDVLRALFSAGVPQEGDDGASVRLQKRFTIHRKPLVEVRIEVANRTHSALRTRLSVELNLTLGPETDRQSIVVAGRPIPLTDVGEVPNVDRMSLEYAPYRAAIKVHRPAKLTHYPVKTVHRHRGQSVAAVQGVCLVLEWPIELWGRERDAVALTMELLDER